MARVSVDADWWRQVGAPASGATLAAGLSETGLPQPICDLVASQATDPVIRYRLTSCDQASQPVQRTFTPTLMAAQIPEAALRVAKDLPAPFTPLQTHAERAAEAPGWMPVLDLPQVDRAPATLQWLPRGRTNDEVDDDLQEAFDAARARVPELIGLLGEQLPFTIPLADDAWHWLCHEIAADAAQRELLRTLPEVQVVAAGGNDADFALVAGGDERSHTGDRDALEPFSAGQRRWIDEALATSARELRRFAERAELYADVFIQADAVHVRPAVAAVADAIEEELADTEYWSGIAFDRLLQALEPALLAAARATVDDPDPVLREVAHHTHPGLRLLQPQIVVRVFDEPEAHLPFRSAAGGAGTGQSASRRRAHPDRFPQPVLPRPP
jgi:hypothetical protein